MCSPLDAIENYVTSIVESRALQDVFWLASALDGYASAVILLKKLHGSMGVDLEEAIGKDLKTVQTYTYASFTHPYAVSILPPSIGGGGGQGYVGVQEAAEEVCEDPRECDKVYILAEERISEAIG
ncbi:hypothetical protein EON63_20320 [archaeon]|nr:MAG: hypothetical protein EON63_20320 [archaeon]